MDIKPEDISTNTVLVSMAGAVLGLKAWPGTSRQEKVINVAFGFCIAMIAGPALAEYVNVTSKHVVALIDFACGTFGLVVVASIIEGIKQTKLSSLIASWLPTRK